MRDQVINPATYSLFWVQTLAFVLTKAFTLSYFSMFFWSPFLVLRQTPCCGWKLSLEHAILTCNFNHALTCNFRADLPQSFIRLFIIYKSFWLKINTWFIHSFIHSFITLSSIDYEIFLKLYSPSLKSLLSKIYESKFVPSTVKIWYTDPTNWTIQIMYL